MVICLFGLYLLLFYGFLITITIVFVDFLLQIHTNNPYYWNSPNQCIIYIYNFMLLYLSKSIFGISCSIEHLSSSCWNEHDKTNMLWFCFRLVLQYKIICDNCLFLLQNVSLLVKYKTAWSRCATWDRMRYFLYNMLNNITHIN